MQEDLFGQPISEGDDFAEDTSDAALPEVRDLGEMGSDEPSGDAAADTTDETEDYISEYARGDVPDDPSEAHKYWQAAATRWRRADREKYGRIEDEHGKYRDMLAQFYQNDDYARQVLAQRFPELAASIRGPGQPTRSQTPTSPDTFVSELEQSLGDYGFLAQALGPALSQLIDKHVQSRIAPIEQRTTQQADQARRLQENELLSAMDTKYEGWEESYGAKMRELDDFLASDALTHPVFGSKYELYYRMLQPDAARVAAAREMGEAAKRRTSLGRTGRTPASNVQDEVRKADLSDAEAFQLAAKAASEEVG